MKDINFNGQILTIDPAKFYVIELDANEVQPDQADYIRTQLAEAGIKSGVIIANPSGKAIKVHESEHPFEGGDEERYQVRINARQVLVEAQNELQQAARGLISTEAEIMEALGIEHQPKGQAEAFSNLFVAIERAYDAAEAPINEDAVRKAES